MTQLDGIDYSIQTPTENAYDMVEYINNYCVENDIRNSKGELIYIDTNPANPLYMIMFGIAYLISALQKLIYSAGCALSVSSSSDRQLLNISRIANVRRREATKTSVLCTIYADELGDCEITEDLAVTYGEATFKPSFEVTVPAGSARNVVLVAENYGTYEVSAGAITTFDSPVDHLLRIASRAATPGQEQESIASLRQRILARTNDSTQIDRCMDDIIALNGVSLCHIYFNYSSTRTTVIGPHEVPPRTALLIVQGYNANIANVFYNHMICLTSGETEPDVITQYYITKAGQAIPLYIHTPEQIPVYVRVYVNNELTTTQQTSIRQAILGIGANLVIAQDISAVDITNACQQAEPDLDFESAELSLDGESFLYKAIPQEHQLLVLSSANINIIEVA